MRRVQSFTKAPPFKIEDRKKAALLVVSAIRRHGIKRLIEGWFHDSNINEIHRENIRDWIAWALFNRIPKQV
jgi:hypothetical protein